MEALPEDSSYAFEGSISAQPHFTVDDMPDLSDLPGFEPADPVEASADEVGSQNDLSKVG